MRGRPDAAATSEERWRRLLLDGHRRLRIAHMVFRHLPSPPRCKVCHNPFDGIGGRLIGFFGYARSRKNPSLCSRCCDGLPPGGAEVDIAVLFADIRGSTALAEQLGVRPYAALMNRFYNTATEVLVRHDAIIDKLVGDEVMALFIPGICGPLYRRCGAEAAFALLQALGEIPIGVAVHSGLAFVGNVGGDGVVDFTALGDTVNTAARLASVAAAGEVLLGEAVYGSIAEQSVNLECRTVTLRGKEEPILVWSARPRQIVPMPAS